jgi:hypothetical protein
MTDPTNQLGQLEAEHIRNTGRATLTVVWLWVGALVGLLGGLIMQSSRMGGAACVLAAGSLLLLLGIVATVSAIRDRDLRVRVYEHGLVQTKAGRDLVIPWARVLAVHHTLTRSRRGRTTHLCTLALGDESDERPTRFQYSDATLKDVAGLCNAIQAHTRSPILDRMMRRIRAGDYVAFRKLVANREGLTVKGVTVPWATIDEVRVQDGSVVLVSGDQQRRIANAGTVPNVHVLGSLATAMHDSN